MSGVSSLGSVTSSRKPAMLCQVSQVLVVLVIKKPVVLCQASQPLAGPPHKSLCKATETCHVITTACSLSILTNHRKSEALLLMHLNVLGTWRPLFLIYTNRPSIKETRNITWTVFGKNVSKDYETAKSFYKGVRAIGTWKENHGPTKIINAIE